MDLINLLKQDKMLVRFTSSMYICRTKAVAALVEYVYRCLYWDLCIKLCIFKI